ncbi:MAG: RrF2 family transcriptional regulator [Coriobacteriia bacterium]
MRISQRLDHALRALTELALAPEGEPVPARAIADALGLPRRFLEQQMTELARAGLVSCRRGTGGGCALARPADDITLSEVVRAVEGTIIDVPATSGSAASEAWSALARAMGDHLSKTTLAEVAARQRELRPRAPMYYI